MFASVASSGTSTFCHNHFPHFCQFSECSMSSCGWISIDSPMEVVPTSPQSASPSSTPFMPHWNVTSGTITFSLCCTGVVFGQFPLLIIYFCKLSQRFITGKQGGNTSPCFAVYELTDVQRPITLRICRLHSDL